MEVISPTPTPLADYTEQLEEITYLLASQNEVLQASYVAQLFCIGTVGAIFVLVVLYNLLKKCY